MCGFLHCMLIGLACSTETRLRCITTAQCCLAVPTNQKTSTSSTLVHCGNKSTACLAFLCALMYLCPMFSASIVVSRYDYGRGTISLVLELRCGRPRHVAVCPREVRQRCSPA